jgi:PAS domain S-box-containing protein
MTKPSNLGDVLDRIKENIISFDNAGNIVYINKTFADLLRSTNSITPSDNITGKNIWKLLPQLVETSLHKNVIEAINKKESRTLEWKSTFSDRFWERTIFPSDEGVTAIGRDITERKKAEEALTDVKERLQNILNGVDDGISLVGLDGKVLDCNEASLKLLGLTYEEFIGTNVYDIIVPEDRQRAIEGASKVLEKGRTLNQVGVLRKNRPAFCGEISVSALNDKNGKPVSFIGVTRDVTERKKLEEDLKESEQLYRTLFDNSNDGFILVEPLYDEAGKAYDFRFIKINSAYERHTGTKASVVERRKASEIAPNLEKEWVSICGDVSKSGNPIRYASYNQRTDKWYDAIYFPFVKGQVGILFTDITERKKAEAALLESEEKYQQLVDRLPEMIFEIDQNGRVIFANLRAIEILGYSKAELENDFDANRFVAVEDVERSRENMKLMFTGGLRQSNEYVFVRKDGSRFPVLLTSSPIIKDRRVVGARGIVVDITERKNMERQLQERERLATIGTTAGMVGHDIRNPLQAIAGDLYLIDSEAASLPEGETKRSLQESVISIQGNLLYIDKIIVDLQDYARRLNPSLEKINIEKVLEEVMLIIPIADNLKVVFDIEKVFPNFISDSSMLKRILSNLVNNAVQAMPNGGTLTVSAYSNYDKVSVCVEDTGTGISEDINPKLFTPMLTTKAKGQGFGLAVVKRFVEALNGSITIESQEGRGTKFTINLPK